MKIVQSLWTKPGKKKGRNTLAEENKCGWLDKKYNYFSWTLSSLQFRKYYDQVELVTDQEGYDLLINKLELPYSNVEVVLDNLNHYHEDLFMLGKLYAYQIQKEPFIHVDADVFIFNKFSDELEQSGVLCQSKEEGEFYNKHYSDIFFSMLRNFNYYPPELDESIIRNSAIKAVNAGIIGGCDLQFFSDYTKKAFEFIDKNIDRLHTIDVSYSNIIFEQFLLFALAEHKKVNIQYLNLNWDTFLSDIVDFTCVPNKQQYLHLYATHKKIRYLVDCMEYRLQKDYPAHYYKIMNLIRTHQI
ncbi:MAG: DUF6734 family protein [Chitinophagaceae bacterium]